MTSVGLEVTLIIVMVLLNGLFAMAEIAVVSARKARLQQYANAGDKRAQTALDLANNPNDFLSTVQIGITLIGTLAGAFGGATIAEQLAARLKENPVLAPYAETIGITIVVLSISYLSLILGELVPKNVALANPERAAAALAPLMLGLSRIASPAVSFLSWSTNLVLRALRVKRSQEAPVTEEEIKVLIEQGTQHGTFEEAEREMVEGVFHLGDRRVAELMTPRVRVVWLDVDDDPTEIQRKIIGSIHSRFPIGQGGLDNLLGIVQVKDLLSQVLSGKPIDLRACLQKPLFIPETKRALEVIDLFQRSGTQMSIVVDEHGGVQGILTLTDIIEAVIGDLPSAGESARPQAVRREGGSWLVDGMMPIADLKETIGIGRLPGEDSMIFTTVGGFVMTHLGRIPSPS